MTKTVENFLVRYLESIGVKIRYGSGDRPFTQVLQFTIDDGEIEERHFFATLWLDSLARQISDLVKRP